MPEYTITELRSTGSFAPSKWEGELQDGTDVYFRYRWATLTIRLNDRTSGEIIFEETLHEDESRSNLTETELTDVLEDEGFEFNHH